MEGRKLTFFDACAGIGCFHHGMEAAGFECVGAAELDERLQVEYPKAFKLDSKRMFGNLHDVTKTEKWKAVRKEMQGCVLTAGFPCQPFSKSGGQLGKKHKEGTVFEALMDIVDDLDCSGVLLENVENLTGDRHKDTFLEMRKVLTGKGFELAYGKYSPHQIGIPQHRQRWFIMGIRLPDGLEGYESTALKKMMEEVVLEKGKMQNIVLAKDILQPSKMGKGIPLTAVELKALTVWDTYLDWLSKYEDAGSTPSPFWAMELFYDYDMNEIQTLLEKRKGRPLTKKQLASIACPELKGREYRRANKETIARKLPPYLWDLDVRKEVYPDWKVTYINNSRKHLDQLQSVLVKNKQKTAFTKWKQQLSKLDPTFQKFEWHIKEDPTPANHKSVEDRLKHRLDGRLIQFRPSGIRVSSGLRHPALVAIGQVPVVGRYLKRPRWQTLAALQSIPEQFVKKNSALFGSSSRSGVSGEPIKRLGNAVNVGLVESLAQLLNERLS